MHDSHRVSIALDRSLLSSPLVGGAVPACGRHRSSSRLPATRLLSTASLLLVALSLAACSERSSNDVPGTDATVGEGRGTSAPGVDGDGAILDPPPFGLTDPRADNGEPNLPIDTDTRVPLIRRGRIDSDPPPDIIVGAGPGAPPIAHLHAALTRVLGTTLLDLNTSLREGRGLTDQQKTCLGAYEPGSGDPLLAVDCERALAAEPYELDIDRGAFAPTDACRAGLATGDADDCVLAVASVRVRLRVEQGRFDRRPVPVPGSGVVVRHGVEDGVFEVFSEAGSPLPGFRCAIDLASGAASRANVGDCDRALRDTADFVDVLLAEADTA